MKTKVFLSLFVVAVLVSTGCAASVDVDKYITSDNPYKDVKIVDKFGQWPEKKGEPYYSSQVGTWFTVWWTAKGEKTFDHWTAKDWTRVKPIDYGYYSSGDEDYLTHVLLRLKYIGIDFIALDDTNGHWNDYGLIAENMAAIWAIPGARSCRPYVPLWAGAVSATSSRAGR